MSEADHVMQARAAYDTVADDYSQSIGTELTAATESPLDMGVLAAFVQLVVDSGHPVADIGCGPGRVAAFLASQDLDVVGVDVSPAMVAVARQAHPALRFETGQLTALPLSDRSLGGAVCWYSIIHTPPEEMRPVLIELARVLMPGASLLLAFQAGRGEGVQRSEAYGKKVALTSYRHDPDAIADALTASGLHVRARVLREPEFAHESTWQAFILARARPATVTSSSSSHGPS